MLLACVFACASDMYASKHTHVLVSTCLQPELMEAAYPLFAHCCLKEADDAAGKFCELYRLDHEKRHRTELAELASWRDRRAVKENTVARARAHSPPIQNYVAYDLG